MICREEEEQVHCYGNSNGQAATGAAPTGGTRVNNCNGNTNGNTSATGYISGNGTQNNNSNDTVDMHSQCKNVSTRRHYRPARTCDLLTSSNCKCSWARGQRTPPQQQLPPHLQRRLTSSSAEMSVASARFKCKPLNHSKENHVSYLATEPLHAPFNCNDNGSHTSVQSHGNHSHPDYKLPYKLHPITFDGHDDGPAKAAVPRCRRDNWGESLIPREKPLIIPLESNCVQSCEATTCLATNDPRLARRTAKASDESTAQSKCLARGDHATGRYACAPDGGHSTAEEKMKNSATSRCGISAHDPRINRCKGSNSIDMDITLNSSDLSHCNTGENAKLVRNDCIGLCKHGNFIATNATICQSPSPVLSPPQLPTGYTIDGQGDLDIITAAINDIDERRVNIAKCAMDEATTKPAAGVTCADSPLGDNACDEVRSGPPVTSATASARPFATTKHYPALALTLSHKQDHNLDHSQLLTPTASPTLLTASSVSPLASLVKPSTSVLVSSVATTVPPRESLPTPPNTPTTACSSSSSSSSSFSTQMSTDPSIPALDCGHLPIVPVPTGGKCGMARSPVTLAPTHQKEAKSNSPPPSPLRLSLPSYSQSHDSPYPDYCIIRRPMSPSNRPAQSQHQATPTPTPAPTPPPPSLQQPLKPLPRSCQYRRISPACDFGSRDRSRSRSRSPCNLVQQKRSSTHHSTPDRKNILPPRGRQRSGSVSSFLPPRRLCKDQYQCHGNPSLATSKKGRRIVAVCCENHEMSISSSSSSASSSPSHSQSSNVSAESSNRTSNHSSASKELPHCTGSKVNYTPITTTLASASKAIGDGNDLYSHQLNSHEGHRSNRNTILRPPSPLATDEKYFKSSARNVSGSALPLPSPSPSSSPPLQQFVNCQCLHSRSHSLELELDHMPFSPSPPPHSSFGESRHANDRVAPVVHRYRERSYPYERASVHHHHSHNHHHHHHHSRVRSHQAPFAPCNSPPGPVLRRSPSLLPSRKASNFAPVPHYPPLRSPDIDERVTRTLHIGRLCPSVDKDELRDLFSSLGGHILSVFVKPPLPTGQPTFAFVKFINLIEAYHAKNKFHLYQLGNTKILTAYGRIIPTNRLWLGNLDSNVDTQFLYAELDRYGTIVEMAHYKDKGEAVVHFETVSGAEEARNRLRGIPIKELMRSCYIAKDEPPKLNQSSYESLAPKKGYGQCNYVLGNSRDVHSSHEKAPSGLDSSPGDTDEVIVVTSEQGSVHLCKMNQNQLQKQHPTLWHKGSDYFKCFSSSSSKSSSCDYSGHENKFTIPDEEDFTKVKKGVIVTDFVDEVCSKFIDGDTNCDSYSNYSG